MANAEDIPDGDAEHSLLYASPHLPKPLHITLADPDGDADRALFSHYLWNASLLLAEYVEAGTLLARNEAIAIATATAQSSSSSPAPTMKSALGPPLTDFDVTNLTTIELGSGTALPSLLAALLGAKRVVITDYPAPRVIANLQENAARNIKAEFSPLSSVVGTALPQHQPQHQHHQTLISLAETEIAGHAWGDLSTPLAQANRHAFDRVLVCDCLWMPWQHDRLLLSIAGFLKLDAEARCWVVAGFHSGRAAMREFFRDEQRLRARGLVVDRIWERDVEGAERGWSWDRGAEDPGERKRWLAVAVLKRRELL